MVFTVGGFNGHYQAWNAQRLADFGLDVESKEGRVRFKCRHYFGLRITLSKQDGQQVAYFPLSFRGEKELESELESGDYTLELFHPIFGTSCKGHGFPIILS